MRHLRHISAPNLTIFRNRLRAGGEPLNSVVFRNRCKLAVNGLMEKNLLCLGALWLELCL